MSNENKQPDERAAFEAWVVGKYGYGTERYALGGYKRPELNMWWETWKEARATQQATNGDEREAFDDVKPLVDEWIRSRGTCMDGAAYGAAVELAAFVADRSATPTTIAVDQVLNKAGEALLAAGHGEAYEVIYRMMRNAHLTTPSPVAGSAGPTDKQRHDEIFSAVTKWLDAHTVPFEAQNELFKAITSVISKAAPNPWESLFDRVAIELNCLPSADVAGNDHVFAEIKKLQAEQQATTGDERVHTGNAEADRIINRLSSSDPGFDDCVDAVVLIHKLVAEHAGPDGFATWKDAAISERAKRVADEKRLKSLFLEAMDFGIGFGPRLSQVGEWKETRDTKADGFVVRATIPSAVAGSAGQAPNGWRSVVNCLPDDGQIVAVFDPRHPELKVWPAQWDAENQAFTAGSHKSAGWFEKDEVTHWTPLPTAPSLTTDAGAVTDERAKFEADYAVVWNNANLEAGFVGKQYSADDVKKLRDGDTYGEGRTYLNSRWEGWQARAASGDRRHVGDSNFEGWYQEYAKRLTGNPKQTARDAYAAGMSDTATASTVNTWRPIETAPKDGSLFLGWVKSARYGEDDEGRQYQTDVSTVDFCEWRDFETGGCFLALAGQHGDTADWITHWIPLPSAPDATHPTEQRMSDAARDADALTSDQIAAVWNGMPGGRGGFLKEWGYHQFALAILEAARKAEIERSGGDAC